MILRISQKILRGNGRRPNDLILVLFRVMFTYHLFSLLTIREEKAFSVTHY